MNAAAGASIEQRSIGAAAADDLNSDHDLSSLELTQVC